MIQNDDLHTCLRDPAQRRLIQVMIRTIAAITHTHFVGSTDATIRPAENDMGRAQFLRHLIRFMILTSLHNTLIAEKCYC